MQDDDDVGSEWDEQSRVYEIEQREGQHPGIRELRLRRAVACLTDLGYVVHRVPDRPLKHRTPGQKSLQIERSPGGVFGCFQLIASREGGVRFIAVTTNVRSARVKDRVTASVPVFPDSTIQEVWVWISGEDLFAVYAREAVTGLWMTLTPQPLTSSARGLANLVEAPALQAATGLRPRPQPRSRSRRSTVSCSRRADTG